MRLPRTIRLDPSDGFVFERAAEPGEWAVTGTFLFLERDPASFSHKEKVAFRSGFAGVASLGFSTLVVVSECSQAEFEAAASALCDHIHARFGAPDRDAAMAAAREELHAAASLCTPEIGSVLAMQRSVSDGGIREQFRVLRPREPGVEGADRLHAHARAFTFVEVDDEPAEEVDLVRMAERAP